MSPEPDRDRDEGMPGLWPRQQNAVARQLVLDLGHVPSHAESDFVVEAGNELAYRHVMAFPDWPAPLTLIVGPEKSGKSHLAAIWVERSGARIAMPDSLEAIAGSPDQRPVLVEDADRGLYAETGVFHLLNQSIRSGRAVLMTARREPTEWPLATEDARSRVRLATRLFVSSPGDALLSQLFVKLFSDRQIAVEPGLISYLLRRMERAPDEAVALVEVMDRLALSRGTAVTRTIAAEAIALRAAVRPSDGDANTETDDHHG